MECRIGIDYGDVRTGVAVCYGTGPALPLCTVDSSAGRKNTARLVADIIKEKNAVAAVVGYPLNMDGSSGKRIVKTEKFARALSETLAAEGLDAFPVFFQDERLTSVAAEKMIRSAEGAAPRKGDVDRIAAVIILQDYIDSLKGEKK